MPSAALAEQTPTGVELDGQAICLVRVADGVFAFDDVCPHRGTPLSEGSLAGTTLTCRAHTWEFDVRTGELLRLRAPACLSMRAVRERDGMIEVAA
jgi:nitrite reductase/ring-hydroxylating ferredoxin subunit